METGRAAFMALYVPTIILSLTASFLYFRGIILPALRRRELTIAHHGLALAIVLGLAMDSIENLYYGIGRFNSELFPLIQHAYPAMITVKVSVMSTAVIALATYIHIKDKPFGLRHVIAAGLILWLASFVVILKVYG